MRSCHDLRRIGKIGILEHRTEWDRTVRRGHKANRSLQGTEAFASNDTGNMRGQTTHGVCLIGYYEVACLGNRFEDGGLV
jgi:hypothetical protein